MKKLKIFFIVIFFMLLAIPVVTFRTEENAVSEVDNRMLAANPVSAIREGEDATQAIENYVNDRIGLRNEMIELYTVGHDKIFHEMIHPSYDMIPSSRTQKYKNLLGGILCPEKVKLMQ